MICAFVLGHEVNKDQRHEITRQRMLEVKRALIGRLADVNGGGDIICCGGLISDYGEPDVTDDFIDKLLSRPSGWQDWYYDDPSYNDYQFWGGYRGERYLVPPPGETDFRDGWGYSIEVEFPAASPDSINIIGRGSDGQPDGGSETGYEHDIIETFYWRREVEVKVKNIPNATGGNITLKVDFVYSDKGNVESKDDIDTIPSGGKAESIFDFGNLKFPVGLRKIVVYDVYDNSIVKKIKMLCLPPGASRYGPVEIDYTG